MIKLLSVNFSKTNKKQKMYREITSVLVFS